MHRSGTFLGIGLSNALVDAEQFERIAAGDPIEATLVEALAITSRPAAGK